MKDKIIRISLAAVSSILLISFALSIWFGWMPATFSITDKVAQSAKQNQESVVTGYATTTALIEVTSFLLNKPGGFLSNDVTPPGVLMDNMPAFEFGALEQIRDLSLAMRKDFSRSQSQSQEDDDLKVAQPQLNIDHGRWVFPSAEAEYDKAIDSLLSYRARLADPQQSQAQFYARADNLTDWLREVEKRLGSLSQKLSSSVGQERFNTDLAGDTAASQSTNSSEYQQVKTNWWKIDDVFYESRGACWALIHFLQAIETDFAPVLEKKNAAVSLKQIIRELESTQQKVWSPVILNGSGFGLVANHSLVMANYVSRANAAVIELRALLEQG